MSRLLISVGLLAVWAGGASAQDAGQTLTIASFDPEQSTAAATSVEGVGIKVGEGTVVHPVVGISTGVTSNVFYEDTDTTAAGVMRLVVQVGAGSLSSARLSATSAGAGAGGESDKGDFQYRASLRAAYDFILSGNDAATTTGGLGLGATVRGLVNPMGAVRFGFDEEFRRLIRAANFETDADTNRYINTLQLNVLFQPPGRSVGGYAYYGNTLDVFERSEQDFANRMQHRFGVHPTWRILPQTAIYGDASIGVYGGIGDSMKVGSFPLRTILGIGTLLTPTLTANLFAGYVNGFYTSGPSYSSVTTGAQVGYRYSPMGRALVSYDLQYEDSVNANYYRDHVVRFALEQQFAPFTLMVQPEVHLRRYDGITAVAGAVDRNDLIFAVVGGINYNFRNELSVGLDYRFSTVQSDYTYMTDGVVDDPSFVRHQLLLGVRWAL